MNLARPLDQRPCDRATVGAVGVRLRKYKSTLDHDGVDDERVTSLTMPRHPRYPMASTTES